jgi:type IV secretory pathway TrbF-like protein
MLLVNAGEEQESASKQIDDRSANAMRAWLEIWSPLVAGKENWQRIAMIEGVAMLFAVAGMIYLGRLPKEVAYVIDRNDKQVSFAGQMQPADMDADTWALVRVQTLKRFVESWRTVTSDQSAQQRDWDRAFTYVGAGSQANRALNDWYEANNPYTLSATGKTVVVNYRTFDLEGKNTVGLWWDETTYSPGQSPTKKEWHARVVYETQPPRPAERAENPFGVRCTELSFSEVNQ